MDKSDLCFDQVDDLTLLIDMAIWELCKLRSQLEAQAFPDFEPARSLASDKLMAAAEGWAKAHRIDPRGIHTIEFLLLHQPAKRDGEVLPPGPEPFPTTAGEWRRKIKDTVLRLI